MTVTRDTTPKQIVAWYKEHWGPVGYQTAYRVRRKIIGNYTVEQTRQFALLPSYATQLLCADPNATVKLKILNNRFSSLFVAPAFSRNAWVHLRPFIAIDASHTKTAYNYVLLLATAIDSNNETINLAWGIAPKENMEQWGWFLDNLACALGNLNKRGTVIMSDRQKGLNRAVEEHLPLATEANCCKHIERNMVVAFGEQVKGPFWRLVYARTKAKFNEAMDALKGINPRYVDA
jgi:hypothetical protein